MEQLRNSAIRILGLTTKSNVAQFVFSGSAGTSTSIMSILTR
jgi:hypothetical protein